MTKKYTLTTSEETVTENPEDIIRLMKLAGLENAQPVAEEVEAEVYEPTEANDKLDLDDYSKKSPESISKQKKSIQPTLGDNPLEYSLDENEIYDAMMKEFPEDKVEEITEKQSPAQKAAFAKMLAAKDGKKDDAVEEKEETAEEKVEETTVEENLEKAQEEIDELKEEELKEDCSCGHGSDCDCSSDCGCGCNAVNEDQDRIRELAGIEASEINEDESVWNQFRKLHDKMDDEGEEALFFSMKHWPKHRFELQGDIDGKDTKNGEVHLGIFVSNKEGHDDNFAGNMTMPQDEIKANITGAAWVGTPGGGFSDDLKGLAGDYTEHDDIHPEPYDDKEPEDQHRRIHAFSKDASGEYHNKNDEAVEEVVETEVAVADEDQNRLKDLINYQN